MKKRNQKAARRFLRIEMLETRDLLAGDVLGSSIERSGHDAHAAFRSTHDHADRPAEVRDGASSQDRQHTQPDHSLRHDTRPESRSDHSLLRKPESPPQDVNRPHDSSRQQDAVRQHRPSDQPGVSSPLTALPAITPPSSNTQSPLAALPPSATQPNTPGPGFIGADARSSSPVESRDNLITQLGGAVPQQIFIAEDAEAAFTSRLSGASPDGTEGIPSDPTTDLTSEIVLELIAGRDPSLGQESEGFLEAQDQGWSEPFQFHFGNAAQSQAWELGEDLLPRIRQLLDNSSNQAERVDAVMTQDWFQGAGGLVYLSPGQLPGVPMAKPQDSMDIRLHSIVGLHRGMDLLFADEDSTNSDPAMDSIVAALHTLSTNETQPALEKSPRHLSSIATSVLALVGGFIISRTRRRETQP